MGWDAYAVFDKNTKNYKNIKIAFKAASDCVSYVYSDVVDGNLKLGGLHLKVCRNLIQNFLGISAYENLTVEEVDNLY